MFMHFVTLKFLYFDILDSTQLLEGLKKRSAEILSFPEKI